ncbi:hypothetical protein Gotri_023945, partial [Gossypium trilobum]|nr:hypothetical protein [Gossypium trilobum]
SVPSKLCASDIRALCLAGFVSRSSRSVPSRLFAIDIRALCLAGFVPVYYIRLCAGVLYQASSLVVFVPMYCIREATDRGATAMKQILKEYKVYSDQCINYEKSTVCFNPNASEGDRIWVSCLLGKWIAFQALKDRVKQRIDNWITRFLSQGDKEKSIGKRGIHWCQWAKLCELKENGGLEDAWLVGAENYKVYRNISDSSLIKVYDLIDHSSKNWNVGLIRSTFEESVEDKILRIPLARLEHEDVSCGEANLQESSWKTCCALWVTWNERNKALHEGTKNSGQWVVEAVGKYIMELDGLVNHWLEMTGSVIISKSMLHGGNVSVRGRSTCVALKQLANQLAHTIASENLKKGVEVYLVGPLPDFVGISQVWGLTRNVNQINEGIVVLESV